MKLTSVLLALSVLFASFLSYASITLGGTRLIYEGNKKEASISITNSNSNYPYLVQSWVELHNGNKDKTPFIVTPPLFKLANNSSNMIRVVKINNDIPQDRESLFVLNVKAIPASERKDDAGQLVVSMQNVIKLIYRPTALNSHDATQAYQKILFTASGNQLTINNPTPYIINVGEFMVNNKLNNTRLTLLPFSTEIVNVKHANKISSVSIKSINDFGGLTSSFTKSF